MISHRANGARVRFGLASMTTTGTVLFALDVAFVVLAWPVALWWAGGPSGASLSAAPFDLRVAGYPIADLLALFAMGLYRRDMVLAAHKALVRVPFVVGMGGLLALLASVVLPVFDASLFLRPTVQEQAMLFAVATICLNFTAFLSRMVLSGLLEQRVLHRRLLVVGAGKRAWDLLHMLSKEGGNLQTTSPSCTTRRLVRSMPGSPPIRLDGSYPVRVSPCCGQHAMSARMKS